MKSRTYVILSGGVFGVVAVFHLLRVVGDWPVVVGAWQVPMWVSWIGVAVPGLLCGWAVRQAVQPQKDD